MRIAAVKTMRKIPYFHQISWFGNFVERQSFRIVSGDFYCWQIVEKKITKSKVDVTFNGVAEMFKYDIKTLKEHIYIKRRQVNSYHEIKFFSF